VGRILLNVVVIHEQAINSVATVKAGLVGPLGYMLQLGQDLSSKDNRGNATFSQMQNSTRPYC
jgi:hypothetical protein